VQIIDAWLNGYSIEELVARVLAQDDILFVGISCYYSSLEDVSAIITKLRRRDFHGLIIAGGYGPSFHGKDFLDQGVDIVVKGESELMIVQLADKICITKLEDSHLAEIAGISWINQYGLLQSNRGVKIQNLDLLPFPARDTADETIHAHNPLHISTSRGCEANCLFCSIVAFERLGKNVHGQWRQRSIQNIVDEIYYLYHQYHRQTFKIVDDSFIESGRDAQWARLFLEMLRERNLRIRFRTQVRADSLEPKIVHLLHLAGWFATSVGIENFADTALRRMNKSATAYDNAYAVDLLNKHGIYVVMNMILFDAETTLQELKINLAYLKGMPPVVTKGIFTEMYAAEGTAYTRLMKRQGQLELESNFMNHQYQIKEVRAKLCYEGLKYWHKAHSKGYDHAINAITAPKDLEDQAYQSYYQEYRKLFEMDVQFLSELVELVDSSEKITSDEVRTFSFDQIEAVQRQFAAVEDKVSYLDQVYDLKYEAEQNPFITEIEENYHEKE